MPIKKATVIKTWTLVKDMDYSEDPSERRVSFLKDEMLLQAKANKSGCYYIQR